VSTGVSSAAPVESPAVEPVVPAVESAPTDVLSKVKSIKGTTLIATICVLLAAVFVVNFFAARRNNDLERKQRADAVLLHDPKQVIETWKPMADGMELTVRPSDPANVSVLKTIRRTMKWQRGEYLRADYSDPRFGSKDLPGRADLEFGTAHEALNVRYVEVDGGAQLRWITTDEVMLDSLKEWAVATSSIKPDWSRNP
jgi:hypothetical protein